MRLLVLLVLAVTVLCIVHIAWRWHKEDDRCNRLNTVDYINRGCIDEPL